MRIRRYQLILTVFVGVLSILLLISGSKASAQSSEDEINWQEPLNLSQSGTAIDPLIVVDSTDTVHVVWEDKIDGFVYATGDGRSWSDPVPARLPFVSSAQEALTDHTPILITDANDTIHAFWIGDENVLLYSHVPVADFPILSSWTLPQTLASVATTFDVSLDENGRLHLGYLRPISEGDFLAGIYYRRSEDGGVTWSDAFSLYQSDYFRALSGSQANLSIDTTGNSIFLVWDNPLLDKVFFARLIDDDTGWDEPVVIDQREVDDDPNALGPGDIKVMASDEEINLVWRAHHEGEDCGYYHQRSTDRGTNWNDRQIPITDTNDCPANNTLLLAKDDTLFLLTQIRNLYYLQAWNGVAWSVPELQNDVTNFIDPVTNKRVTLGCEQVALTKADRLIIIGCSQTALVQDVWVLTRQLGDLDTWFPNREARAWSLPDRLFQSEGTVKSPTLVADLAGNLHAFWIEMDASDSEEVKNKLYHSQWDGVAWSRPVPVQDLETEMADQLTAVFSSNDRLMVTWYDSAINSYFLRQVDSGNVRIPGDWSSPLLLSVPHELISRPSFFVSPNGTIYLTYAVPLNEGRGIYEIHSEDDGTTWTEPALIADAIAKEWLMVDKPYLTQAANGQFHALWTENDLKPAPIPVALHYAHTSIDGQRWEEPIRVAEGDIRWSQLANVGEQGVVIIWQQASANETQLWSQQSFDGGLSWERPFLLRSLGEPVILPALTKDESGELHLVRLLTDRDESLIVQEWVKSGNNEWHIDNSEILELILQQRSITHLMSGIANNNQLVTIFSDGGTGADETGEPALESIYFTLHNLDLLLENPDIVQTTASTRIPPTTVPAIVLPGNEGEVEIGETEPPVTTTPTAVPTVNNKTPTGILSSTSTLIRVGISVGPPAFIVIAFFVWRLRKVRQTG